MNTEEMDAARAKPKADRARDVMDNVRCKGSQASQSLIDSLREVDQYLFKNLGLGWYWNEEEIIKMEAIVFTVLFM